MIKGKIINNTNGYKYKVLDKKYFYTLLETVDKRDKEYIVAYDLHEYKDGYCWGQGHYFSDLENAQEFFKGK